MDYGYLIWAMEAEPKAQKGGELSLPSSEALAGSGSAEGSKGWGTFTRGVTNETWVATGPFSGCYVAAFDGPTGKGFAHLITPAAGYTAASVDEQMTAICSQTGSTQYQKWGMNGIGLGIAFFMLYDSKWHRRSVWVAPTGKVMDLESKSTII